MHWQDDYDLEAYGDPALAAAKQAVTAILESYGGAAGAACAVLLAAMWWRAGLAPACGAVFAAAQLAHVMASIACYVQLAGDGWLVHVPLHFLLLSGWMGVHRFRTAVAACTVALIVQGVAVPTIRPYRTATALATRTVVALAYWVGAVWISHTANLDERRRWRRAQLEKEELGRLRAKLQDLLPDAVAQRVFRAYGAHGGGVVAFGGTEQLLPCERCSAAVLELDVAGFTAMTQVLFHLEYGYYLSVSNNNYVRNSQPAANETH
jgi:hypothetical protein